MDNRDYKFSAVDLLYGSYIRYERLMAMTKFAFYGKTDSNSVNIFIDAYSILRNLYTKGTNLIVDDSCAIASCLINLAIHLRAYFETRHRVSSAIFIVYGGARSAEAIRIIPEYNAKNIFMEDSNGYLTRLIRDNLDICKILTPYLHDIFTIVDYEQEFGVLASNLIDIGKDIPAPNIIYSKDPMSYQLVAFKPRTFLYRPKKRANEDVSWVATKSTLYNAFRNGEMGLKSVIDTNLSHAMISIYMSLVGVKSRNLNSLKNANVSLNLLHEAVAQNVFCNGYNAHALLNHGSFDDPFSNPIFTNAGINPAEVKARFRTIDLVSQTVNYQSSVASKSVIKDIVNLYDPDEVRAINNRYFQRYPLDLNRV